jgi:ABC-type multidrug transport system permease subunit
MNVMLNLRAVKGRAFPRVVGGVREPSWVFWQTFLPLLSMAAYIYMYRSLDAPREFEGFVVLGGVMTTYWLNVLWGMASQLYWEKETANLQLYLAAPMSKMSILAGMALGGMFYTSVRGISIILIGVFIFNVDFVVTDPFLLIAIFLITLIALYYQVIKYLYISPLSYFTYLIGRSAMRFLLSILPLSVLIVLGIFLKVPYNIDILLLVVTVFLGWVFIVSAGLLLCGINMLTARHGESVGQAFAGIFYLFSGVIFPLNALPGWAQTFSRGLPSTYWFSLVRRSVLGGEIDSIMSTFTTGEAAGILLVISAIFFVISYLTFRFADFLARKKGILDMTTTY